MRPSNALVIRLSTVMEITDSSRHLLLGLFENPNLGEAIRKFRGEVYIINSLLPFFNHWDISVLQTALLVLAKLYSCIFKIHLSPSKSS
jgi:hypothetical protein